MAQDFFSDAETFGNVRWLGKSLGLRDGCRRQTRWKSAEPEVGELLAEAETDLG